MEKVILTDCLKSAYSGHKQVLFIYDILKKLEEDNVSEDTFVNINSGKVLKLDRNDGDYTKVFLTGGNFPLAYKNNSLATHYVEEAVRTLYFFDRLLSEYETNGDEDKLQKMITQEFKKQYGYKRDDDIPEDIEERIFIPGKTNEAELEMKRQKMGPKPAKIPFEARVVRKTEENFEEKIID